MLPSLSARARRLPRARLAAGAGSVLLLLVGLVAHEGPAVTRQPDPPSLAERLAPSTWALAIPTAWLAAPLTALRPGDRIDLLGLRAGERPTAVAIAFDLEVMSVEEGVLVVGVGAHDATGIAASRAAGQLIVPLLRSRQ